MIAEVAEAATTNESANTVGARTEVHLDRFSPAPLLRRGLSAPPAPFSPHVPPSPAPSSLLVPSLQPQPERVGLVKHFTHRFRLDELCSFPSKHHRLQSCSFPGLSCNTRASQRCTHAVRRHASHPLRSLRREREQ